MPAPFRLYCNTCRFELSWRIPAYVYIEDDAGRRLDCQHPAERFFIQRVMKVSKNNIPAIDRVGCNSPCICLDCAREFELDLGERWLIRRACGVTYKPLDERRCPYCSSENVLTFTELIGRCCPKCREGIIFTEESDIVS